MTAADRVQEAPPRPGHGAPGRHSAYNAAGAERRPALRRPTAWVVAPSVCSAVLTGAAIVIVVNGAHSAGYHISSGTMTAVWVLGGLILAVVVATLAFAGRPGRATEIPVFGGPDHRQAPPMAQPQPQPRRPHQQHRPQPAPAPLPQQAPPPPPMSPQVVANATEAAATLAAATKAAAGPIAVSEEGVDLQVIFAQLVRRLLTLVLQQINRLDELENEVEDPKLLKSLFGIDHQATQVRRYGENIGVLVGALPQRQWTHPVPVTVAQRSAVSETPDYPRVQVIPRAPGRIHGHAVSDVIHILSELVENATNYSNPTTKVTVGAHRVSAGLAIEINDHGIGMESDQFRRLNTLLRDPSGANVKDLLSQGRIGLSVVAKMAQRHGIAVELAPNVTGGTMALVVIPDALLAAEELPADKGHQPRRGIDHTQLPARPALAPLPDTLPPAATAATAATASTAPSSAASLSPVAASTPPPLSSPATAHVPPLPTSPAAAAQESARAGQPMPVRATPPLPTSPLPTSPTAADQAARTAQQGHAQPDSSPSGHRRQTWSQPAPAEPQWPSINPPVTGGASAPTSAAPVPGPTGSVASFQAPSADRYQGSESGAAAPSQSDRYPAQDFGTPAPAQPDRYSLQAPDTAVLPATPDRYPARAPAPPCRRGPASATGPRRASRLPSRRPTRLRACCRRPSAASPPHPAGPHLRAAAPGRAAGEPARRRRAFPDDDVGLLARPFLGHRTGRPPGGRCGPFAARSHHREPSGVEPVSTQTEENLSWLINRMLQSIPAARSVLLMSTDGLVRAYTTGLNKDEADTLAAAESGMWGIVTAIGKTVRAGGVRQVVVELDGAFLCVGAAGPGTCIGVLADREADPRQIGFEMQRCVTAVVRELSTAPRGAADGAVAAARARS